MQQLFRSLSYVLAAICFGLPAQAGEILLTKQNLVPINQGMWAAAKLSLPEPDPDVPIIGAENKHDGVRLLRLVMGRSDVNGFNKVLYDNRDRAHSNLKPEFYPGLTHLKYGSDLRSDALDAGLAGRILFPAVVFGNSSTAVTNGHAPRSLPRLAMTHPSWRQITPLLYTSNHIYVYPEHRDYDEADRFPINWPFMIISQGSSGSDQEFLNALALTLAALPRDTFEFLRENGLVAPTLQMILRRNMSPVSTREAYLSGVAHPAVFQGRHLQTGRMVEHASQLRPEEVPPLVRLRVVEETFSESAGLAGLNERFLDTPSAIGRTWRSFAWEREMIVSADETEALLDQPLSFEWRLLRGDPQNVSIERIGPDGRDARIRINWHDPWSEAVPLGAPNETRRMSRVDIGVFVNNGVHDSAPALISIDFPDHQIREYAAQQDGEVRLTQVDYDAKGRDTYFDPLLYWTAPWTDIARYDESDSTLLGWDRVTADGTGDGFAAVVLENDQPSYQIDVSDMSTPTLQHVGSETPVETE